MPRRIAHRKGHCHQSTHNRTPWVSRIRVEKRNGRVFYSVFLTNGRLSASLHGGFSRLPVSEADLQAEAFDAAASWLCHVKPDRSAPAPKVRRLNYQARSCTEPRNRQHRKHGLRRAA